MVEGGIPTDRSQLINSRMFPLFPAGSASVILTEVESEKANIPGLTKLPVSYYIDTREIPIDALSIQPSFIPHFRPIIETKVINVTSPEYRYRRW